MPLSPATRPAHRPTLGLLSTVFIAAATYWVDQPTANAAAVTWDTGTDHITMRQDQLSLPISITCPSFTLDGIAYGSDAVPSSGSGDVATGRPVEYAYSPLAVKDGAELDVKLYLQWFEDESVLRKWVTFEIKGAAEPPLLQEIVLERTGAEAGATQLHRVPPQSYPLFFPGFFAGIEYPVSTVRVENGVGILAHAPGIRLQPGTRYESRRAVYGPGTVGREREAFSTYITKHNPYPKRLHLDYNTWWSTGVPYTEIEMLELMAELQSKLTEPYGIEYDTVCIDLGWSDKHTIWDISKEKFPTGFAKVQAASQALGGNLGVWISPVSAYPEGLDNNWAKEQGYKTFPSTMGDQPYPLICMTDDRYRSELAKRMADMTQRWGVRLFKLDNYRFACSEAEHGHEPGDLAAEPLTDAIIAMFDEVRAACPDVWIESSAFGAFQSPWWLYHVDSVLGELGDDYPYGAIPCPYYQETYTTCRDFHNFQGLKLNATAARDQAIGGIEVQSPDPFINDAVVATMRGNYFLSSYVNPDYMAPAQWKAYAGLLKWALANEATLYDTRVLLPASMSSGATGGVPGRDTLPREPYGYAHERDGRGLIVLRNSWVAPQSFKLDLKEAGFDASTKGLSAVSLYPQVRVYGKDIAGDDVLDVPLAPYETIVLSLAPDNALDGVPPCNEAIGKRFTIVAAKCAAAKVELTGGDTALAPDSISPLAAIKSTLKVEYEADVEATAPQSKLLVLIEDAQKVIDPLCTVWIDGKEAPITVSGSDTGWAAAGTPPLEHWLFLMADLPQGASHVRLELLNRSETASAAAWVWATAPAPTGETPDYPNALPAPEQLSIDAANLFGPISLATEGLPTETVERPITTIAGIYLDALDPARVSPDAATLERASIEAVHATNIGQAEVEEAASFQRNRNVAEQPITIFGRHYLRGIGMQGPAKLTVALNGEFSRFQAWAGLDGALNVWEESTLTFQVRVDGKTRWESKKLKRNMAPEWVDVDVSGAKLLELVVIKEPSQLGRTISPWADWADAKLLR